MVCMCVFLNWSRRSTAPLPGPSQHVASLSPHDHGIGPLTAVGGVRISATNAIQHISAASRPSFSSLCVGAPAHDARPASMHITALSSTRSNYFCIRPRKVSLK